MTKKSAKPAAKPATKSSEKAKAPAKAKAVVQEKVSYIEKVGKAQLVELITTRANMTKKDAGETFNAVMDVVVEAVKSGKRVTLPGLGTLSLRETAGRTGVRPGTTDRIQIPAGKKVSFKVSTTLKAALKD